MGIDVGVFAMAARAIQRTANYWSFGESDVFAGILRMDPEVDSIRELPAVALVLSMDSMGI